MTSGIKNVVRAHPGLPPTIFFDFVITSGSEIRGSNMVHFDFFTMFVTSPRLIGKSYQLPVSGFRSGVGHIQHLPNANYFRLKLTELFVSESGSKHRKKIKIFNITAEYVFSLPLEGVFRYRSAGGQSCIYHPLLLMVFMHSECILNVTMQRTLIPCMKVPLSVMLWMSIVAPLKLR